MRGAALELSARQVERPRKSLQHMYQSSIVVACEMKESMPLRRGRKQIEWPAAQGLLFPPPCCYPNDFLCAPYSLAWTTSTSSWRPAAAVTPMLPATAVIFLPILSGRQRGRCKRKARRGVPPWNSVHVTLVKSSDRRRASNTCTRAPMLSPANLSEACR